MSAPGEAQSSQAASSEEDPNLLELGWDDAGQVDVISLELGYGLIPMVDADTRWACQSPKGHPQKLSAEMGFLLPSFVFETISIAHQTTTRL